MTKVLVVLDYMRTEYLDNEGNPQYLRTPVGKGMLDILTAPRKGLGLASKEIIWTFAYNQIPPVTPQGKYKPITKAMGKEEFSKLNAKIMEIKPDLILCFGGTAALGVLGKKGISGLPEQKTFHDDEGNEHQAWVMTNYSIDNLRVNAQLTGKFNANLSLVKRYLKQGESAFTAQMGSYQTVTDFEKVKAIFDTLESWGQDLDHVIAMDFETNTLNGHSTWKNIDNHNSPDVRKVFPELNQSDKVSAEILMISLSIKEEQGWTIPIQHRETPFTEEQRQWIIDHYLKIITDDRWVVGHNFKFDIMFNKGSQHEFHAHHCIDTMIMYYVGVEEDSSIAKKGLKELAYQYTNMGGYDHELDDYKAEFPKKAKERWIQYQDEQGLVQGTDYRLSEYVPPVNELDGTNFNYDWIPLKVIGKYASGDTDACLRIYHQLKPIIDGYSPWQKLVYEFYPELVDSLTDLEANGAKMDLSKAKLYHEKYDEEQQRLLKEMYETVPEIKQLEDTKKAGLEKYETEMAKPVKDRDKQVLKEFSKYKGTKKDPDKNIKYRVTNPTDNKMILFGYRGLTPPPEAEFLPDAVVKRFPRGRIDEDALTWQDYSLSAKTTIPWLQAHYPDDEFLKLYSQIVKIAKIQGSFVDKLPYMVDQNDFAHTTFVPTGTVTGRLASRDFNIQQLPSNHGTSPLSLLYKYPVKSMFTSRFKGGVILNADYSFLEIRVAALISQDPSMIQVILDGVDYHRQTASLAFAAPPEEITKKQRQNAKSVSFGKLLNHADLGSNSLD